MKPYRKLNLFLIVVIAIVAIIGPTLVIAVAYFAATGGQSMFDETAPEWIGILDLALTFVTMLIAAIVVAIDTE